MSQKVEHEKIPQLCISWIAQAYAYMLALYPNGFRQQFADEMQTVFCEALDAAAAEGWPAVGALCLREVRDWPHTLLTEYWHAIRLLKEEWLMQQDDHKTNTPGLVPSGYGSIPHFVFVWTGRHPRLRRLVDLALASIGLAIAAPIFLLLPLLIKLTSPGPVFYRQVRVGKAGQLYTMYKFRSMVVADAPPSTEGAHLPQRQITRLGHWMRRYSLDEMPQFFNVLKGEMSIFGPRPGSPTG